MKTEPRDVGELGSGTQVICPSRVLRLVSSKEDLAHSSPLNIDFFSSKGKEEKVFSLKEDTEREGARRSCCRHRFECSTTNMPLTHSSETKCVYSHLRDYLLLQEILESFT